MSAYDITEFLRTAYRPFAYCVPSKSPLNTAYQKGGVILLPVAHKFILLCQGGIDDDRIKLTLEPEAASIWCQQLYGVKEHAFNRIGSKYMVADLGGAYLKCCYAS